ncbi:MAG: hypothetical protein RLZZ164_385 [Actinomycetota bacterium]
MFQPKRQRLVSWVKPNRRGFIPFGLAGLLLLGCLAPGNSSAWAASATPTPAPSISASVTVAPTPTVTPTPTPTAQSIDRADSLWVVVNKTRPLNPIKYKPVLDQWLNLAKPAATGYRKLKSAMTAAGVGTLCLNSGYRSYATQTSTYNTDVARYGKKIAENLAAHPGYSEHQTGLAADVSTTQLGCRINNFGSSKAAAWIAANAYSYGFIVRYPSGQTAYTGYQYEPWHLRFVGVEVATAMHNANIVVLEKYFGLPAAPGYLN